MFDRKVIRLIIYLVISVAIIIVLLYLPKEETGKEENKHDVLHVELPENDIKDTNGAKQILSIYIDSLNNYRVNDSVKVLNELKERLTVQKEKDTNSKLFIEVDVHPKSNAEKFIDLVKLSEKLKIKIRIN